MRTSETDTGRQRHSFLCYFVLLPITNVFLNGLAFFGLVDHVLDTEGQVLDLSNGLGQVI